MLNNKEKEIIQKWFRDRPLVLQNLKISKDIDSDLKKYGITNIKTIEFIKNNLI